MNRFAPDRYYLPTDPELQLLGTPAALAQQRYRGQGPPYTKLARRILYRGRDLNAYLDHHVIEPRGEGSGCEPAEPGPGSGEIQTGSLAASRGGAPSVQHAAEPAASSV